MSYQNFNDLKGKVCVLTGGTGVIGSSLAQCLALHGIRTAILGQDSQRATDLASELATSFGTDTIGLGCNVLDKESLENAKEKIHIQLGKIDLLINAAGGNSGSATTQSEFMNLAASDNVSESFFGLDVERFRETFDLNLLGTVISCQVFAMDMISQKKGVILNISSMNSFRPLTKIPAYSAAKAGVNNFTEWLSVHLAKTGIRVNAIAPGFFKTRQNRFLLYDELTGELSHRGHKILEHTPMGRFGEPKDLHGILLFLLSDASSFITGTVIPVDGGFNAYSGI